MVPIKARSRGIAAGEDRPGPATHFELFAGLRDAGVEYLLTGATALCLHGVPRISPDIDLLLDPGAGNVARALSLLAAWGYAEGGGGPARAGNASARRFSHGASPLDRIDLLIPPPCEFARLLGGAVAADLVGVAVPLVGVEDLRAVKSRSSRAEDVEDAAILAILADLAAGRPVDECDTRVVQVRKFSRWSIPYRCNWLLEAARLAKGLSPEAKAPTRGLVRRRPWVDR